MDQPPIALIHRIEASYQRQDLYPFTLINGGSFDEFEPDVPANEVLTGTWTHVAATYDGTTTTIYLNGVAIAENQQSEWVVGSSTAPYYIGWNSVLVLIAILMDVLMK
ncbi:MAG: LamG domain-containing protein [Anaerolineales bacterium]|nr:LamG domain-containing protein [Anaerolineales bacterium]